jgi:membrane fusion protein, copper/silver efflux system
MKMPAWARNVLLVVAIGAAFALGAVVFRGGSAPAPPSAIDVVYTCSMHPQIRQPTPGTCPLCGMDLIPAKSADAGGSPDRVQLSERARALARIRTQPVARQADPTVELRLLGRVEADETALRTVTAWTAGRIERLHVNVTGQAVRAGEVVATLYSPELYAAHQDLITARAQVDRAASPDARAALDATRARLRLLGVPDGELARLESTVEPTTRVPIRTPFAGTVLDRVATEGDYVPVGGALYRVADLSRLWVQLDAYERDLPLLKTGARVAIEVDGLAAAPWEGRVAFVDPTVDPRTRAARVRVEIEDRAGLLRPGQFVQAIVQAPAGADARAPLVVPSSAPLFTGKRSIVYVQIDDSPTYAPRVVRLGPRAGDVYPVVSGLAEGERVVVRGAFAIDADLQIQGGRSMMSMPDDSESGPWDRILPIGAAERSTLAPIVAAYLDIQTALADDRLDDARGAARRLGAAVPGVRLEGAAAAPWPALARALDQGATRVGEASSLEAARAPFEPLSDAIRDLLQRYGNPIDRPLRVAFCPMASGSKGATWIQDAAQVDNAYFGHRMRRCGELRDAVEPGAHLPVSP